MRAEEFIQGPVMAKIERTGQVVQILKHEDDVKFSDDKGWFLVNTEPGRRTGTGVKWIPDSTRFAWVKNFESLKEYTTIKSQRASRGGIDLEARKDGLRFQINATAHGRELGRVVFDVQFQGKDTILVAQDLMIHPEYRGQGIAAVMYDYAKELGYVVERSPEQTDAGRAFWDKNRGPDSKVWEQAGSKQATAKQVLNYINKTHYEPFRPGEKMYKAVLSHPQWELVQVPLLNLNIPDEEYDDVEQEPESDPYGRVMAVEPGHAGEVSADLVDRKPIVIDSDRYIIDGNHRAWAAKYLLNRDYIQAWRPVN
jgi:GNAT superfamily N-acetyltransferase